MRKEFFPARPELNPQIYAYSDSRPEYKGLLKIGFTNGSVEARVKQQYPIRQPIQPYAIQLIESAIRTDGSSFTDRQVHRLLEKQGVRHEVGEWYACTVDQVKAAIDSLQKGEKFELTRTRTFGLRPEQAEAVRKTKVYFESARKDQPEVTPRFLWNAKMRFGKTFASYQLAKQLNWKRILIITFKPAVEVAWEEDLMTHKDFDGWQFVSRNTELQHPDEDMPIVYFGSFQDLLGKSKLGGIKVKNEWIHSINWDCVILDEYHFGAWRDKSKKLFDDEVEVEELESNFEQILKKGLDEEDRPEYFEGILPITTNHYLYLSGTPFRAIASGEFIEEQVFNWTYSDEQRAKNNWQGDDNPYAALPRMVMLTYQLPEAIRNVAMAGEFSEFDLNVFFSSTGSGEAARFKYEAEVQKWLDLIRGNLKEGLVDSLKQGTQKPPMPYSDTRLLNVLNHTFWFLPTVASCYAMRNLLGQRQNVFYQDYNVVVAAGTEAGMGVEALKPVFHAIGDNPLKTKTITLSCGKLTTGVSVKPWTGIFMLRNCTSPETYFQAAFRVQTPWTISNPDGTNPNRVQIVKEECYVFDFAPDRALRQVADYSCRLSVDEDNHEQRVADFISFLPVLAYDGSSMKEIDAAGILDIAMSGTTATLLARRWESALLVNVDNDTLARILANPKALEALSKIEGFRSLNDDIETIINKSESVKKAKKEQADGSESDSKTKKALSEEEKEYKSKRKEIQDKLIKFATRIPVFMYLTDYRERTLKDVITQLEPALFKKVTGLEIEDFDLLVSLNVFNSELMNDAVYKFKRYEDSSLEYTGIRKHNEKQEGLFDSVIEVRP